MTKHTPGPWKVINRWPMVSVIDTQGDAPNGGDHPVGDMHLGLYRGLPRMEETVLANAKLIAAAPDLLEALEALTHEYHAVREGQGWHYELESITKARAALAKAEGEVNE